MRTFVISLKRSNDRREYMQKILRYFPYQWEFFEAIDGQEIKNIDNVYNENKAIHLYGKGLKHGEIGCALSHLAIYQKMLDEDIGVALILEDDIIFAPNFSAVFSNLKDRELNNDIILLGQLDKELTRKFVGKKITDRHRCYRIANSGYGTHAYLIDIEAAKKILDLNFPVCMPADFWKYLYKFINIYIIEPYIVDQRRDAVESTIDKIEPRNQDIHTTTKPVSFLDELSLNCNIFNFLSIATRKMFSLVKITDKKLEKHLKHFYYVYLPTPRIK